MNKKPIILQINESANRDSHGKIVENIGRLAMAHGWYSVVAYGRVANASNNNLIRIGSKKDVYFHVFESRLLDNHGRGSRKATCAFIKKIESINPDIIHLHNIHGYYLNYKILFDYLSYIGKPIIWTLHDCWAFTGHCAYFDFVGCERWKNGCYAPCPNKREYPKSFGLDASNFNYQLKKKVFTSIDNLTIVPVSQWLGDLVKQSFLRDYPINIIRNGIDLNVFHPHDGTCVRNKYGIGDATYVLGVANVWERRKGYDDFIRLVKIIPPEIRVVLVGLDSEKVEDAKKNGIIGIPRTEDIEELVALYSGAEMFLNLTLEDNYPTTNLEAIACGTPVITYNTGGSPESVSKETGWVVPKGDVEEVSRIIVSYRRKDNITTNTCVNYAELYFSQSSCFAEYLRMYNGLLKH